MVQCTPFGPVVRCSLCSEPPRMLNSPAQAQQHLTTWNHYVGVKKIKKEKKKKKEKKEEEQAKDWLIKICNLHLAAMARRREAKERWLASLPPVPLFSS